MTYMDMYRMFVVSFCRLNFVMSVLSLVSLMIVHVMSVIFVKPMMPIVFALVAHAHNILYTGDVHGISDQNVRNFNDVIPFMSLVSATLFLVTKKGKLLLIFCSGNCKKKISKARTILLAESPQIFRSSRIQIHNTTRKC